MKGQISRYTWSEAQHYSGVYQVQGGMVTDADLGETSEIARARTDQLGDDAIHDGVPALGGIIAIANGKASLRAGTVYADGVRGVVTARAGLTANQPLDLITKQLDFPSAPAPGAGAGVVYADVWERGVFPLEDGDLTDVALHGAETSFRGKTMAQIKWAPIAARPAIEAGNGAFPLKGDAVLAVSLAGDGQPADDRDPCAELIPVELRVPNALLRLEVVHVTGPANAPQTVQLAWSRENAAEQYKVGTQPEGFGDSGVFEFFSAITDSHMGAFANPIQRKRSAFAAQFPGAPRARDDGGPGAGPWPFVRRWDGHAEVNVAGTAMGATLGAGFQASLGVAGGALVFKVVTDSVTLTLNLKNKSVLAGDYWLVELREFAPDNLKARVLNDGLPVGIQHHHCVMFETAADGTPANLSDADRRRVSFPALSDIPARNVSLDPNTCPKLFGNAENVQQALTALCAIEAADISFDNNCQVLYGDANTVQEALEKLCAIDFSANRGYRQMFDWGVVCGLDVRLLEGGEKAMVRVSAGSFLDRSGKFVSMEEPIEISLNDPKIGLDFEPKDTDKITEYCIAIAVGKGGLPGLHIVERAKAFGPADPSFCERVTACYEQKPYKNPFLDLKVKVADRELVQKVILATANKTAFKPSFRVVAKDATTVEGYVEVVSKTFKAGSTEAEHQEFLAGIADINAKYGAVIEPGEVGDIRRGQKLIDTIDYIGVFSESKRRDCVRDAIIVPCPPALGEPPYYVPLACVETIVRNKTFFPSRICVTCCRKQALTLRAMRYRQGGGWENDLAWFDDYICHGKTYDQGQLLESLGGFQRPNVFLSGKCLMGATGEGEKFVPPEYDYERPKLWDDHPDIKELGLEDARRVMIGNGAEVVDVIDVAPPDALDKLLKQVEGDTIPGRLDGESINPGDKVAILQRNGVAQGFVVIAKGSKLLFEPAKVAPVVPPRDVVTGDILDKLREAERARDVIVADLDKVKEAERARDIIVADLDKLAGTRSELATQVETMKREVEALAKTQVEFTAQLEKSRNEIADVAKQRDTVIRSFRTALPVSGLGTDAQVAARLTAGGLTSIGDIEALTDAAARKLVDRGVFKDAAEAKAIREAATTFVRKPVG